MDEKNFLIYTEKEGDTFQILDNFTDKKWIKLLEDGSFEYYPHAEFSVKKIKPVYASYVTELDSHDFVLEKIKNGNKKN